MSKEESQNAQTAETQKQSQSDSSAVAPSYPKPPVLSIDIANLNPSMLQTAENLGIPLKAIVKYVSDLQEYNVSVEARLQAIVENLEPAIKKTVYGMVQAAREQAAQAAPSAPISAPSAPPASSMGALAQMLPQLLPLIQGAGNSGDDIFKQMALDSFKSDIAFSRTLKETFLSKIGAKVVNDIAETIT